MVDLVAEAKESADKARLELERLERLQSTFPDLSKYTGRWKKVVLRSALANPQVTDFDQRFNCGCCSDSPLEVWPYVETPDGRVYSNPACFMVGEKTYSRKVLPYPEWDKELRKAGIPAELIDRIARRFTTEDEEASLTPEIDF